jgi:hypothetical protein
VEALDRFCGERPARAADADRFGDTFVRGAWHGAWTMGLGVVPAAALYFVRFHVLDLPWAILALKLASFAPACGACYGAGIALGDAAARAITGRSSGVLSAIFLPALGGAIFGLAPGSFAAEHLGRLSAPYFGTVEILASGTLAFFLYGAAALSRGDRVEWSAVSALALALVPPLTCGLCVWAFAPEIAMFADSMVLASASLAPSLAIFGAACGAILGAFFGASIGVARALIAARERGQLLTTPRPRA